MDGGKADDAGVNIRALMFALLALACGHVLSTLLRTIPAISLDLMAADFDTLPQTLASLTSIYHFAFAASQIPVGAAMDRFGVRPVSLSLLVGTIVGATLSGLSIGPKTFLFGQFLLGAATSGMLMCPMTLAAKQLSPARFGLWSGVILSIGNIGMLLSSSPLAWVVDHWGWRAGFWISAGSGAAVALAVYALVPNQAAAHADRSSPLSQMASVLRIGLSRPLRGLIAISLVSLAASLVLRGLWGGPWLMEVKGLSRIEAGNELGLFTIALIAGPLLIGIFDRKFGFRREVLAATHFLAALLLGLMAAGGPHFPVSDLFGVAVMPAGYDGVLLVLIGIAISAQPLVYGMTRQLVDAQNTGKALSAIKPGVLPRRGADAIDDRRGRRSLWIARRAAVHGRGADDRDGGVFTVYLSQAVFGCRFKRLRDSVHTLLSVEERMYPDPNSSSQKMYDRALSSLPGGNTRTTVFMKPYPIYAARGEGCRVWDLDGNEFIDCINNFTSQIHGHAHPVLIKAATAQLALGSAFGLPTESEVELAELLAARLPSVDQVRFCNSGTEAVMMALKTARAHTGRPKIAKCEGAYHGSYDYAEVSLDPTPEAWGRNAPVSIAYARGTPDNVLADVLTIPFNDTEAAVSLIREHCRELACVLVDPMPNRAGLAPAEQAYLEAVRKVTREVGALLIFDEVITFRLGYRGAQGLWNIAPDLTTLGKIIGGGFPVGAVCGAREFMAVFDPRPGKPALPHGGTFSANPVTMRAGIAAMELLDQAAFAHLDAMGQAVRSGIDAAFRRHNIPGRTVGLGSLLKIHFADRPIRDYRSAYPTEEEAKRQTVFSRALLNRGVLAAGNGLMALSTPMTDADIDAIIEAVSGALSEVSASL